MSEEGEDERVPPISMAPPISISSEECEDERVPPISSQRVRSFDPSQEYLYAIYHRIVDFKGWYEIWRCLTPGDFLQAETPVLIPTEDGEATDMSSFVSIGSKLYMIGFGGRATRILELETKKFHTNDLNQIVKEAPPALAGVRHRNAVAIGGKIYTFPHHFGPVRALPLAASRFQVFDPATVTTKPLPEPPVGFPQFLSLETYLVLKTHLLLCVKRPGRLWIFAFDTAREDGGWIDVTRDYLSLSARNPSPNGDWEDSIADPCPDYSPFPRIDDDPFPVFTTRLDMLCATALGGPHDEGSTKFFVTTESYGQPVGFAVVEWGDDPFRIKKWYKVVDLPKLRLGHSCFTHGGDLFFTFTYDDRPRARDTTWEYEKYSLSFVPGDPGHFVAKLVSHSQLQRPITDTLRASFMVPPSL